MNRFLIIPSLALGIALALTATPSLAQDSGLIAYAGVLTGYDDVTVSSGSTKSSKASIAYGAVLGAETAVGETFRVGLEAEYMGSHATSSLAIDALNNASARYGRDMFIGVRGGFDVAPHLFAYLKGGYTNRQVSVTGNAEGLVAGIPTAIPFGRRRNLSGYRLASGIEYGSKLRARLEYRYSHYEQIDPSTDPAAPTLGIGSNSHQVVAGLLYGF